MWELLLDLRSGPPACYDMACRYGPMSAPVGRRGGFRIGDRAAAYVFLHHWRRRYPDQRLIVLDDPYLPHNEESRSISSAWMFQDVADELWVADTPDEVIPRPPGKWLHERCLWLDWKEFRDQPPPPLPRPPEIVHERVERWLERRGIQGPFMTVHPLLDAAYDRYRNGSPLWWQLLIDRFAGSMPLVVLGLPEETPVLTMPAGAYPVGRTGLTAIEALSLIQRSWLHVGGETGFSLWAPILGTSTVALYADPERGGWGRAPGDPFDTRPIPFHAPVLTLSKETDTEEVVQSLHRFGQETTDAGRSHAF